MSGVVGRRSMTSRDIHESIRQLVGKQAKILLKAPVRLELKGGDKTEARILVFTAHRLFVMTAKVPTRIDHHFHYLEFSHVESKRPNHISFQFHGDHKTYTFRPSPDPPSGDSSVVDEMILVLVSAVKRIFPGVPVQHVIGNVDLHPADRGGLRDHLIWKPPDPKLVGPCGGFSGQYAAMCDFFSLPFREEVAWDVDTIYFSHDSHEMCLQDFEHLDHRDLICIISALEHNTWFTKLKASANSAKLSSDLCERVLSVVGKSISLEELHVPSIGVRWDFAAKLAQMMLNNPKSVLTSFDLSCNFLEDKGIHNLSTAISKMPRGLHHVNLSYCQLSPKGVTSLSGALVANKLNPATLTYLNLAGNTMKDESHALCSFLAQPNHIAILDISSTDTPLDALFGALVRGCTAQLTHLNLSRNPFSSKKAKEIPAAFKQFFAGTLVLQYLNMSHCKMPPEAVKHLLLGLACNEATANVELTLNNNNFGANGANVFESCIGGVKCISRLDLSENNIDAEMAGVMQGIARNRSLLSLNVSKNMTGVKPKHLANVIESIVLLLQDEECQLNKLNMSDCKLKAEINNVINALGSNQCLQHLDISGNHMGDIGARLLAKALQINTRLKIINLDRNGISLQGYTDITYSLQSNYAMRHIPFPTYDLQHFIKTHPDRVDGLVHRMQELLQRNSNPTRFKSTAQAFRLTQGFLMSSTQQILDRVSAQAQDNIDAMKKLNPENDALEEIGHAEQLVRDAESSKHLPSALHEVTARGNEVDLKLKQVSLELSNFVLSHVQQNVDAMLHCAERQCPTVMNQREAKMKAELRAMCEKKCQISPDFISTLIMNQLGLEVHNKINELNLIIASNVTEKVIDEIIDNLGNVSKNLVSEVGSLRKKRSLTPDVLKGRSTSVSESLEQETISLPGTDATSQRSESSPLTTPQTSKRKSLHGRKLRPKSVADGHEKNSAEDDDDLSAAPDLLASSTPKEAASSGDAARDHEDRVPELPFTSKLQHLGKARPKRSKRHAPSRGAIVQHNHEAGSPGEQGDDGGLSRFYSSHSANNSFSPSATPSGSPQLEDVPQPRSALNSSTGKEAFHKNSRNSSKEDLSGTPPPPHEHHRPSATSIFGMKKEGRVTPSPDVERKSPMGKSASAADKTKAASSSPATGLSSVASSTLDEDSLAKASPEKRALSPSLHAISDIFATKSSAKDNKDREGKVLSPGISPFAARKGEAEFGASRRKSFNTSEDEKLTSPDLEGKKTPEGVVKRHGVGHGGNPDLMAEIKEKRASMVPKSGTDPDVPGGQQKSATSNPAADDSKAIFGRVKLRSTGLAGNLTSPTNEFTPVVPEDKSSSPPVKAVDHHQTPSPSPATKGGSIVGLRASKFSSGLGASPAAAAEGSKSKIGSSPHDGGTPPGIGAKPKPLPKPRPWSIVGVDRKSGEMTSVSGATSGESSTEDKLLAPIPAARKSSVRDMINNMNSKATGGEASQEHTPTEGFVRKKGSSLPRGVAPPPDEGTPGKSSPSVGRKESTTDDPRILKLDDDFAYDDVLDV